MPNSTDPLANVAANRRAEDAHRQLQIRDRYTEVITVLRETRVRLEQAKVTYASYRYLQRSLVGVIAVGGLLVLSGVTAALLSSFINGLILFMITALALGISVVMAGALLLRAHRKADIQLTSEVHKSTSSGFKTVEYTRGSSLAQLRRAEMMHSNALRDYSLAEVPEGTDHWAEGLA